MASPVMETRTGINTPRNCWNGWQENGTSLAMSIYIKIGDDADADDADDDADLFLCRNRDIYTHTLSIVLTLFFK